MSTLPIASEIEAVAAIVDESPAGVVMAHLDALEAKIDHIAKEALKEAYAEIAALKKALKKAIKVPRAKRSTKAVGGGAATKGEAPKQVGVWNAFVKETQELMKTSGWPSFDVTDKMGNTVSYPGGAEEKGKDGSIWVVDADEPKKRVVPSYKLAMSYAAYRKANGEYTDPAAEEREAAKAAKAAEKEAAKAAKAAEREAKKLEKEAAKAAAKEAKETKAAAKPVKTAVKTTPTKATSVKATPANGGAGKAEEKPKAVVVEEEEDDEIPVAWTHGKKKYFKTPTSHMVWEMNGTKPGAWVGVYDPITNKIDTSAEKPEYEFD